MKRSSKRWEHFFELAVCEDNPYLQECDLTNEKGMLKWLAPRGAERVPANGRLFINGQVMHYNRKHSLEEGYWGSVPGLSLSLKDLSYEISIDRPPLTNSDLSRYISSFVALLTPDQRKNQLQKTKALWQEMPHRDLNITTYYSNNWPAWLLVLWKIVTSLDLNEEEFVDIVGPGQYLYLDRSIHQEEYDELQNAGFIVCPAPFKKFSLEPASHQLESYKRAQKRLQQGLQEAESPDILRENLQEMATKAGAFVAYPHMPDIRNADQFLESFRSFCAKQGVKVIDQDLEAGLFRFLVRRTPIADKRLHTSPLPRALVAGFEDEGLLYSLRGFIAKGLSNKVFESAYMTTQKFVIVFSLSSSEELMVRIIEREIATPGIELNVQCNPETLTNQKFQQALEGRQSIVDRQKEVLKGLTSERLPAISKAIGGVVAVTALSLWLTGFQPQMSKKPQQALPDKSLSLKALANVLSERHLAQSNTGNTAQMHSQSANEQEVDLTRTALERLLKNYSHGGVAKESAPNGDVETAKSLLENMIAHHAVKDLEMLDATPQQKQQMELIRRFFELSTGVKLTHTFRVFKGQGAKGFNKGGTIALHEKLFQGSIDEALSVVWHEAAHTVRKPHDGQFMNTLQALAACSCGTLRAVAEKSAAGKDLSRGEQELLRIPQVWEELTR